LSLISLPGTNKIKIPGITQEVNPHITLVYLGDDVDALDLIKVVNIVSSVARETKKFIINVNYSSVFSKGEKGYPIICPIESVDICVLRDKIVNSLNKNKIQFANNYMVFRPHQTICFSKKIIPSVPLNVSWEINKINIWPADKGTRGEIPVSLLP
jgi:2'-5' RNA ligase